MCEFRHNLESGMRVIDCIIMRNNFYEFFFQFLEPEPGSTTDTTTTDYSSSDQYEKSAGPTIMPPADVFMVNPQALQTLGYFPSSTTGAQPPQRAREQVQSIIVLYRTLDYTGIRTYRRPRISVRRRNSSQYVLYIVRYLDIPEFSYTGFAQF